MRKLFISILLPITFMFFAPGLFAQQVATREIKNTPAAQQTGEPEGSDAQFQPLPVNPIIFKGTPGWFRQLARSIENGTATMPQRRTFYGFKRRLAPFYHFPSGSWRIKALLAAKALVPHSSKGLPLVSYQWKLLGPKAYYDGSDVDSGRATAIWSDPADKNHILLGTAGGGVWKTTDQGVTWTPIFNGPATMSIGSLAVDPNNLQVIYVGTGEGNFNGDAIAGMGLYKTSDGGATWQLINLPFPYQQPYRNIRRVVVDPRDSNNVYAAGDGGLFISNDAGATWRLERAGATGNILATDLVIDGSTPAAGQPSIIYVAFGGPWGSTANGVYRSTDAGNTWVSITGVGNGWPSSGVGRITLLKAPSAPATLYALVQDSDSFQYKAIYRTQDGNGSTVAWTTQNTNTAFCGSQCWYDISGAVDPADPDTLIVGGIDDYISTNGGVNLTRASCWSCSGSNFSHADHHYMTMPDSTTVYDANDGGFFIGTISGTNISWVNRNTGLSTLQFYSIAQHPTNPDLIMGGLQDNGQAYFDGNKWREVYGGDGGDSAWDQQDPHYAYEEYVYGDINRNSHVMTNPADWHCIADFGGCSCGSCVPDGRIEFIAPFELDPNSQQVMYTGTYRLWKNGNARTKNTWNAISGDLTAGESWTDISAIHPAKDNGVSGTIYVGTSDGKVQVTKDGGNSWTDRSAGLPGNYVTSITTDAANSDRVLVTVSGYGAAHVFRSLDGGANWTDITGALPNVPFNSIVIDPGDANRVYAGSEIGVFTDSAVWTSSTWVDATGNLPATAVMELQFNPSTGALRAATHGRAIWELQSGELRASASATPVSGAIPLEVSFAAAAYGGQAPYSYDWNFGDGSAHAVTANPTHLYTSAGTYSVTLIVTDNAAAAVTKTLTVSPYIPQLYYPDDSPFTLNFSAGADTKWRVDCSTDGTFSTVDVSSKTGRKKWLTTNSWSPGTHKWGKILALGNGTPSLGTMVYWRSVGKNIGTTDSGVFQISKVLAALTEAPADGGSVSSSAPPTFSWNLNHNKKAQVEFSDDPDFNSGVLVSSRSNKAGKKWIKGSSWTPGSGKWGKIVAIGSIVYWRIYAKDSTGRESYSDIFTLNITP